jgi:hypothetical protein
MNGMPAGGIPAVTAEAPAASCPRACGWRADTPEAPWTVVKSNDKKRAGLEAMRSLLAGFEYEGKDHNVVGSPDPMIVGGPSNLRESGADELTPMPAD